MRKKSVLYISCDYDYIYGSEASLLEMIQTLGQQVEPIVLLNKRGALWKELRNRSINCIVHPFCRNIRKVSTFQSSIKFYALWVPRYVKYRVKDKINAKKIVQTLISQHIDIVHTNNSIISIGAEISKILGVPHVWHIREAIDLNKTQKIILGRPLLFKIINHADARIVISSELYKHYNLKSHGTYIIGDAVRSKKESILNLHKEKFFLFCSGVLTDFKGTAFAVEAFCKSNVSTLGYTFKLIGRYDDTYKTKLLNIAKKYGKESSIELLGYKKNVKEYFIHATAFIMATEFEGLGRVSIEAMFYGCPVIARKSGGQLDFIKANETGFFFETMKECTMHIQQIISTDTSDIIRKAQELVEENYSYEIFGERISNLYNKTLS